MHMKKNVNTSCVHKKKKPREIRCVASCDTTTHTHTHTYRHTHTDMWEIHIHTHTHGHVRDTHDVCNTNYIYGASWDTHTTYETHMTHGVSHMMLCNRLQQTATDCNRLQQTATDCNRLQQTAIAVTFGVSHTMCFHIMMGPKKQVQYVLLGLYYTENIFFQMVLVKNFKSIWWILKLFSRVAS